VFFVNVPLAGSAAILAFALIPVDPMVVRGGRFDLPGALSVTIGVTLAVFALVQGPRLGWGSPAVLLAGAGGALLLGAFALIERKARIRCCHRGCWPIATSLPRPRSRSCSGPLS